MADKNIIKPVENIEIPYLDLDLFEGFKNGKEPQIYFSDDLIAIYNVFRGQVYDPQSVLYSSCGLDASPAKVFDKVTFVDIDDACIKKLQESGFHAVCQDIRTYTPKDLHDLLILLDPEVPTVWATQHLRSEGYVIANNYHGNASGMYQNPDQFTLWGVIDSVSREKGNNVKEISRNLEGLFEHVKNEAELIQFRPEYHKYLREVFQMFASTMRNFNADRPFEQVWADYREFLQEDMPSKRVADRYIFVKK